MGKYVLDYVNENEYKKLESALKKYNMIAYKKLYFEHYPHLIDGNFEGEQTLKNTKNGTITYELRLPSDKLFVQIHGEVKLVYTVYEKEKVAMLETIMPEDILMEGHRSQIMTYKGVIISKKNAEKEKFKIDLITMMQKKGNMTTIFYSILLVIGLIVIAIVTSILLH